MGDAAQAGFDAAGNNRDAGEGAAQKIGIDDGGAVYRLSIESTAPAAMPMNRRGAPSVFMQSGSWMSGWAMRPTRKPLDSSTRPITAAPKAGWST